MSQNKKISKSRNFFGYLLPQNPLIISIIAIFAALTCVLTLVIRVPVPTTSGYINIGDIAVMFTGLLFGPIIGGIAGGIGPAIADLIGYPLFTIPTLIIKGLEGFVVGLISNPRDKELRVDYRDIIAVVIGGVIMVSGYFLVEAYVFGMGIGVALSEVPGNLFQFLFGIIGSILLISIMRKNVIVNLPHIFNKVFIFESLETSSE